MERRIAPGLGRATGDCECNGDFSPIIRNPFLAAKAPMRKLLDMRDLARTESQIEHEEALIRAFFQRDKQERFLAFVASGKNRKKLTQELAHFRWFDSKFATPVPWKVDPKIGRAHV